MTAPDRIALRWEPGAAVTSGPLMAHPEYTNYLRATPAREAAEDLLAALLPVASMEMWTESADDDEIVLMTVGTVRKIRAVIAKARGQT